MHTESDTEIFNTIFRLFEWIYKIKFSASQKEEIVQSILMNWQNDDKSDQELLEYLLHLSDSIESVGASKRSKLRPQAISIFSKIFAHTEYNERGRILQDLHRLIEQNKPGSTEALLQAPFSPSQNPSGHKMQTHMPAQNQPTSHQGAPSPYFAGQLNAQNHVPPQHLHQFTQPFMAPSPAQHIQDLLQQERRQNQLDVLRSNIESMRHDTTMSIIRNIR